MREGWTTKRLGEVGTFERGKGIQKNDFVSNGKPCIHYGQIHTSFGVFADRHISEISKELFSQSVLAQKGDLLFALTSEDVEGSCKATAWLGDYAIAVGSDAAVFHHTLNPKFVSYYFCSNSFYSQKQKYARGFKVTHIKVSDVASFYIPVPPFAEQERIVTELDLLQGIIDKQKAQLKELDTLAQSIFYDMFGDPVENEKGWPSSTLLDISTGKLSYGSGASAIDYDGKIRYIRITDIDDNGSLRGEAVSPSDYSEKYLLHDGDILFARTGATVGKTYLHKKENGNCIYAGYLIRLVPNKDLVLPEYVFGFTKTLYYKRFVALAQKAVAQPNINAEQYGSLLIGVPPISLQQAFATKIEAIERQKASINASIAETQKLFDYTMDKYFG